MAYTQADLDRINETIASGERRVRLNNREIEYPSVDALLKAKADIEKELDEADAVDSGVRRPRSYRSRSAKGY